MADGASCPMCGQPIEWEDLESVCAYCHMAVSRGVAHYVVRAHGRVATLCSRGCVYAFLAVPATGLLGGTRYLPRER